eukprot:scaffold80713_cov42-Prasinocladus_malaysianus.AAC.3
MCVSGRHQHSSDRSYPYEKREKNILNERKQIARHSRRLACPLKSAHAWNRQNERLLIKNTSCDNTSGNSDCNQLAPSGNCNGVYHGTLAATIAAIAADVRNR